MDLRLIDAFEIKFKSAVRNLNSAILIAAMLLAFCHSASAQQPKKAFRIGYLSSTDRVTDGPRAEGIRRALHDLGYVEGQNIIVEYRYAEGKSAVFGTSNNPDNAQEVRDIKNTAAAFAVKAQYIDVLSPKDIEIAFRSAAKARAGAVMMNVSGPIGLPNQKEIAELAVKYRLPVIYTLREYVEAGGLMNYGVSITDLDRRTATYVDKILKGRKPADLPVEQPTKFEFTINLNAAKQIGLTIPPNVLARADRVIK